MFLNLMCEGKLLDLLVLQWLNSLPAEVRLDVLVYQKMLPDEFENILFLG